MAQIIRITSEALQATIRRLLPSQQGFGEDLQASNVIQPIIDLTPSAEGSALPLDLSSAWDLATTYNRVVNANTTIQTTPGFYVVQWTATITTQAAGSPSLARIYLDDGTTSKDIWTWTENISAADDLETVSGQLYAFLGSGVAMRAQSNDVRVEINVHNRQIADLNGNITNPLGFTQQ